MRALARAISRVLKIKWVSYPFFERYRLELQRVPVDSSAIFVCFSFYKCHLQFCKNKKNAANSE